MAIFVRVRDAQLRERKGIANPFYDIGQGQEIAREKENKQNVCFRCFLLFLLLLLVHFFCSWQSESNCSLLDAETAEQKSMAQFLKPGCMQIP